MLKKQLQMLVTKKKLFSLNQTKQKQSFLKKRKQTKQSKKLLKSEETEQEKYDRSLKKTRTGFGARLNAFFANFRSVDEEFFEELEELLIMSDVGVQVASNLNRRIAL